MLGWGALVCVCAEVVRAVNVLRMCWVCVGCIACWPTLPALLLLAQTQLRACMPPPPPALQEVVAAYMGRWVHHRDMRTQLYREVGSCWRFVSLGLGWGLGGGGCCWCTRSDMRTQLCREVGSHLRFVFS